MKLLKVLPLFLLFVFSAHKAVAQDPRVEVTLMAGYQFFGHANAYNGEADVNDNVNYHAAIGYALNDRVRFHISYFLEPTQLYFQQYGSPIREKITDVNIHYIMAGSNYELQTETPFTPYGGAMLGLAILDPKSNKYNTATRMAFGIDGGVRAHISGPLSFKIQATLMGPIQWVGGGLMCGGGGCDVGVSSGTTIIQLGIDGESASSFKY